MEKVENNIPVETVVTKANMELGRISIKRKGKGIELTVKSEMMEEFFKDLSGGEIATFQKEPFRGLEFYRVSDESQLHADDNGAMILEQSNPLFIGGRVANASYFRAKGIKDGVKFLIPFVGSEEKLDEYREKVYKFIKAFYKKHMKPYNVTMVFTVSEANDGNN